jgi:nucleoside-diphosphate kinase
MTLKDAQEFYAEHKGKPFFDDLTKFITSDFVVGLELVHDDPVARWRALLGPTNCQVARVEAPKSIRGLFGTEGVRNAAHGSDSRTITPFSSANLLSLAGSAQRELDFFFSTRSNLKTTALFTNCTCAIVKPHIIQKFQAGRIIDMILTEGFEISAMHMFYLDRPTSEEFLEVYKGVLPEYSSLVDQLITGPCIALEIRQENVVKAFRELCGPHDPEIARVLRPKTIRAKYGLDRVKNAVHCTDLAEDGVLEVFHIVWLCLIVD